MYLFATAHAKHVSLAIQSAAMAKRDLFPRKYDTNLPSRDLVLRKCDAVGFSLALLVGGGTCMGYESQHNGHFHHGTWG